MNGKLTAGVTRRSSPDAAKESGLVKAQAATMYNAVGIDGILPPQPKRFQGFQKLEAIFVLAPLGRICTAPQPATTTPLLVGVALPGLPPQPRSILGGQSVGLTDALCLFERTEPPKAEQRQAYLAYNEDDLEQDRRDLDPIAPQGSSSPTLLR